MLGSVHARLPRLLDVDRQQRRRLPLLARTETTTRHAISCGYAHDLRYGERVIDSDEAWPSRAVHDPEYFGIPQLCYHLEYSFANGKPMHVGAV